MKRIGITRFPGTNCDYDIETMVNAKGYKPVWLWHRDRVDTEGFEAIMVPGGFSYGDYLRCGALAAKSAVMDSVRAFASKGGPVLGICNGFQILCESGLLPGVLVRNRDMKFIDEWTELVVESSHPSFGKSLPGGTRIKLPIAHGEGCFRAPEDELKRISDRGQIWLRYTNNPNGSALDIAGVTNETKNVAALMPHPERALFDWMGGTDGWSFL